MKISLNWLKEYLPSLELSGEELARTLLGLGFEVSGTQNRGAAFSGVVAAKILSVGKHPNADRLSLCSVETGGQTLAIVCGAKNIAAGQIVPLAKPGAKLPDGRTLAKSVIRGVESQGMLCSGAELGLDADHGGILILDPTTPTGSDLSASLAERDLILDVEITPNRPDCLSHLGLAREISAALSLPLRPRETAAPPKAEGSLKIEIADALACPFYLGRVFADIEIKPSPGWLAAKLESIGLRPVNNLVDITNYLLMDMGQPLHAFDCDALAGGTLAVRWAKSGEIIEALDGKAYALSPECLVIADAEKPAAVAGVMGGAASAVTSKTKRTLLESACFAPEAVRRTSQILRLRSDSSYRFERGTDPAAPPQVAARAARMIQDLCGQAVRVEAFGTAGNESSRPEPIKTSIAAINAILGAEFAPKDISQVLSRISDGCEGAQDALSFTPPSYRRDLSTEQDLAEEAARLLGYDRIPSRSPAWPSASSRIDAGRAAVLRLRGRLSAAGLLEAYNQDFLSEKTLSAARQSEKEFWAKPANPLSEDVAILRPSLLPGLLQNAALNFNRGARTIRLFEIGKTYRKSRDGAIAESSRAAGILSGATSDFFWRSAENLEYDFYRAKGVLENALSGFGGLVFRAADERELFREPAWADLSRIFHPGIRAAMTIQNGPIIGLAGMMHPEAAAAWDFGTRTVCLFEIDLESLRCETPGGGAHARATPYSPFPGAWRDISLLFPAESPYAQIEQTIRASAGENLTDIRLIDVFSGDALEKDRISMTLRLFFGRSDRTLSDAEVSSGVQGALAALGHNLDARLREK